MVAEGRRVAVHYTGRVVEGDEPGEVFDTTDVDVALESGIYHGHRDYRPLEFRVGDGEVIAGIDEAVREMSRGETRTVRVEPEDAFGSRSRERVREVSRADLEARSDVTAAEGELVVGDSGETGWIVDLDEDAVVVDFNHELAGETLEFEVHLVDILD